MNDRKIAQLKTSVSLPPPWRLLRLFPPLWQVSTSRLVSTMPQVLELGHLLPWLELQRQNLEPS